MDWWVGGATPYLEVLKEHDEDKDVVHGQAFLDQVAGKKLHGGLPAFEKPHAKTKGESGTHREDRPTDGARVGHLGIDLGHGLLGRGLGHGGRWLLVGKGVDEAASLRRPVGEEAEGGLEGLAALACCWLSE